MPTTGPPDTRIETTEIETLNSRKAIWLKDKSEISEEEYHEFYKHISHDYAEPAKTIHYNAEGTTEFSALLYLRRAQIMDHCEAMLLEGDRPRDPVAFARSLSKLMAETA